MWILLLGVLMLGRWWQVALWVVAVTVLGGVVTVGLTPGVTADELIPAGIVALFVHGGIAAAIFGLKKAWLNHKLPKQRRPGPAGQR
ncbi:hypothetical protein [Brevundimonas sp.]|uniref:hypothetical protein n=1 Tax=Brevundimonas sp. TaxID=1871086 RepID=UPI00286BD953|nr:hypothetical protein [Brevundimonas sp.]